MIFGDILSCHRRQAGLTLREFSQLVGCDASNISKIETGSLLPPREERVLRQWSRAVGLDPDSMLGANFVAAGLIDNLSST